MNERTGHRIDYYKKEKVVVYPVTGSFIHILL